eukprot:5314936-Pleurochrysis_carterae.AAC.1
MGFIKSKKGATQLSGDIRYNSNSINDINPPNFGCYVDQARVRAHWCDEITREPLRQGTKFCFTFATCKSFLGILKV